jgi:2',3'-cyclic-nucleotide 2'-phosphodiesterase/3'-nucleotidase
MTTPITRRTVLASVAAAGVLTAAGMSPAEASRRRPPHRPGTPVKLTIMGTTDLHGCVFNWDYFKNSEYTDSTSNDIGLAKVATLVEAVRTQRGRENTLMIDAGDTIQGTPLAYYYARIDPITQGHVHPMAAAMNHIGYDAAALGSPAHAVCRAAPCAFPVQRRRDCRPGGRGWLAGAVGRQGRSHRSSLAGAQRDPVPRGQHPP